MPSHKLIHIGEFDEREAGVAFDIDWSSIDWITLGISTGDPEKKALYDFLKQKYVVICNFFQHFVGTGRIGDKYGMTLHEFGRVLHLCRLLNYSSKDSRELCKKIFFTFAGERVPQNIDETMDGGHALLSRSNFVECLVKYSMDVWCKRNDEEGKQDGVNLQVSLTEILIEIVCGSENYIRNGSSDESEGDEGKNSSQADVKSMIKSKCPGFNSMTVVWKTLYDSYMAYDTQNENVKDVFLNFYHSVKEAFLLFTDDDAHRTGIVCVFMCPCSSHLEFIISCFHISYWIILISICHFFMNVFGRRTHHHIRYI